MNAMSIWLTVIIVCIAVWTTAINSLVVTTFNVEQGITEPTKRQQVHQYLKRAADLGTGLFVLTEIKDGSKVSGLAMLFGDKWQSKYVKSNGEKYGGLSVAFIYNTDEIQVEEVKFVPKFHCRNIVAKIIDKITKEKILLIAVHLKAMLGDKNIYNKIKTGQARHIIKYYNGRKCLVVGDLNEEQDDGNGMLNLFDEGGFKIISNIGLDYVLGSNKYLEKKRYISWDLKLGPPKDKITSYRGGHTAVTALIAPTKKALARTQYNAYYDDMYLEESNKDVVSGEYYLESMIIVESVMLLAGLVCICFVIGSIAGYTFAHLLPSKNNIQN